MCLLAPLLHNGFAATSRRAKEGKGALRFKIGQATKCRASYDAIFTTYARTLTTKAAKATTRRFDSRDKAALTCWQGISNPSFQAAYHGHINPKDLMAEPKKEQREV